MFHLSRIYFGFCNDNVYDIKNVSHKRSFTGHSHKRPKIKVPRLLHLTSFGTAKLCVITDVYGTRYRLLKFF